jgi:hypothetical protein
MGMSFGSVGGAGAAVACQPIYPPRDLFVSDVGPPGTRKLLFSWRRKHRFAQVTDQGDRELERFIVAIRTSQEKLSGSDFTQDRSMTIHGEWHERTAVGEGVESALLVRLENGRQGAALGAQLCQEVCCHRLAVHHQVVQMQSFGRLFIAGEQLR